MQHLDDSPLTFIDALTNLSSPSATSAAAVVPNVAPSLASSSSEAAPLRPLYDLINSTLKGKGKATNTSLSDNLPGPTETLVIIDDLSALEWMGVDLDDVSKFVRALQARCRSVSAALVQRLIDHTGCSTLTFALCLSQTSSSLVLLTHGSTTSSPSLPSDTLFRTLYPSVDLLIQCRGLSSGRSGEVSGEVSVPTCSSIYPSKIWLTWRDFLLSHLSCDQLSFTPTPLLLTADPAFPATSPGKELQYKLGDSTVTFFAKGTGYGFL